MKHEHRFSRRQDQKQDQVSAQQAAHEHKEFANSDELLRHDRAHTAMPPEIAVRLKASLAQIAAANPPQPWWKAWMRR